MDHAMVNNSELGLVGSQGSLQGFSNLFAKENQRWWRTRYWLVQLAIWLVIVNGVMALIYRIPVEQMYKADTQNITAADRLAMQEMQQNPELIGLTTFVRLAGLATVIGVIVIAQDALIQEKQSGTAAWVLSKPASRSAFILAKLAGNGLGIFGVMTVLVGAAAYLQIWLTTGVTPAVLPFAGMLGLVFLNQLFYLTLTLMIGAFSLGRGAAIGIPLVIVFGYQIFLRILPGLIEIMPWNLVATLNRPALALTLAQGQPLPSIYPILFSLVWCALFIAIALWRFQREEF
jgi:ABC-2 type transport system permease protein